MVKQKTSHFEKKHDHLAYDNDFRVGPLILDGGAHLL